MKSSLRAALGAVLICAAPLAADAAAPRYTLTDLGIAAGYDSSFAYGLSDDGTQVAGWVATNSGLTRAARWSVAGGLQLLELPTGATGSRGFGINDAGHVAGEMSYGSLREATVWDASSQGLGTLSGSGSSVGFGINNAGQVAGWSDSDAGTRAFGWTSAGGMTSLGALPGGTQSRAYSINASGAAAGWGTSPDGDRGFLADGSTLTPIATLDPGGAGRTRGFGISNNGWVVGDARDPALGDVAFAWSAASGTISLGMLPGAAHSFGADINSIQMAVGWNDGLPQGELAFLWTAGGGMVAIDELLVDGAGWQVQRARAINDAGIIVGNAVDASGQVHAVLLTPIPEPASAWMVLAGLAALAAVRRGRRRRA